MKTKTRNFNFEKAKYRKAQVKIFESIAVLIMFVFLVAIGVKFYSNTQMASLEEAQIKFSRLDSVKTSIVLSNMPELTCSFEAVSDRLCVDLYKIQAWNELMNKSVQFKDYYYGQLGESKIIIDRVYPDRKNFTIYNNPPKRNNSNSDFLMVPTTIYSPLTKQGQLGIINIKTYYK
jgi:hypothetical protein